MSKFKIKNTIYHGTIADIDNIDLTAGRGYKDFGKGFYLAYDKAQSIGIINKNYKIALKRKYSNITKNLYAFDTSQNELEKCKVKVFNSADIEWLDFILNCRSGKDHTDYDMVIGGVANDKVFNTVELFFDGLIDKTEAIGRLRYEKPNLQIAFRTDKALTYLHFEGSEQL